MTNPTRQEIIDAHKTLEYLIKNLYDIPLEEAKHTTSYERLAKFLPPKPQPTMDKIAWDDDEHYLAEVENRIWGRGIMLHLDEERDTILCQFQQEGEPFTIQCELDTLTPTGKRYTLTETQE